MQTKTKTLVACIAAALSLTACDGDDGSDGSNGLNSLILQTVLPMGDSNCFQGGVRIDSGQDTDGSNTLDSGEIIETSFVCSPTTVNQSKNFNRIASFPVCSQLDATCNIDDETAAEIVAATADGMTLVYTDSPLEQVGFVDLTDPENPLADGTLGLSGEPTSVAVKGDYALVGVNTSADFVNVSGHLEVIGITSQSSVRQIDLGGQPDSVAISPDGNYAAVVIENERDEDLGDGVPPQAPAGTLVIVNTSDSNPANWTTSTVDLTQLNALYPGDPEPEYVDINGNNIAVVTLQENNHIALVDLTDGSVVNEFSAGSVDLTQIDATEEDPALISQTENQDGVLREPDGVAWINNDYFATADEGDLDGGSRGFTVFHRNGEVAWNSAATLDHMTVRFGHYPDGRSGNKGNEPENAEVGIFGDDRYLFVNSERSTLVFVYDAADPKNPVYKQTLPAGVGPEGGLAIPSRNLLVVASEEDNRGDKIRSVLNIYRYATGDSSYPTIRSDDRMDGTPIPWSALSGLTADPMNEAMVYAVEDSFYQQNRILAIDTSESPAILTQEMRIMDSNDVMAGLSTVDVDDSLPDDDASRVGVFDDVDLSLMINTDKSINIDPEGIAKAADGGFWVVSEGSGTIGDENRPINSLNLLLKTDPNGVIEQAITLPQAINDMQLRFGFEGVTEYNGNAYVAFQRVWDGDTNVRIGVYDTTTETWSFLFYPLDTAESQDGGWVGLSDITSLGNGEFLVLERDNKGNLDAAVKRLYRIDVTGLADGATVTKTLVRDLIQSGDLSTGGMLTPEKLEGLAVMSNGDVLIVNDNDGVDDNSGETQLINLGGILD
ncbi:MAG: esterase-like activity of phytase family protein [Candidatus Thiodiazotropha sp. (ex. Lucinisca nassula)]|nr:esterase-like activity of phytase family protein [Candidatus Thiodiazotropha sp. (ex. Lucinisca nassula)]